MKKAYYLLFFLLIFYGCDQKNTDKKVLRSSNGGLNHLLVVMDNAHWHGLVGDKLREILTEPVLGLPQPEPQFDASQITEKNMGSLLKASRNILILKKGEANSFDIQTELWASPQKVITIQGIDDKSLINNIQEHANKLVLTFKEADLSLIKQRISKDYHPTEAISTFKNLGFSLKIPSSFKKVEDDGEMVWYRSHINGGDSMELFAYSSPITPEFELMSDAVIVNRNAFGKKYVPGEAGGSYMITEEAYTPHIFQVEINGYKAFESRGKWEVKDMYMAGPFLNYTFIDDKNDRLVIVEGLTYAPATKKRDYMFELEAILKTMKID